MEIETLSDFRLVALHGGFGKASRASGRPKATLSKRVIDLEASLGVRLFTRTSHTLYLTDEGQKLYAFAEDMVDAINHMREELGATSKQPRGKLRIAAPSLFTYLRMGQFAVEFMTAYPEVELETVVIEPPNEPTTEVFDLLIKTNPPSSSEWVGRIFARDTVRVVGSPAAVERLPAIQEGEINGVPAVAPTGTSRLEPWELHLDGEQVCVRPEIKLHLPSRLVTRDAVCAGFGFAELPAALVGDDIRHGRLVDLGPAPSPDVELWVLYASRRLVSRRVSVFISFLCDYFKQTKIAP